MVRAIDQDSFSKAPATTREPAGQTRTSGLPGVVQGYLKRKGEAVPRSVFRRHREDFLFLGLMIDHVVVFNR